MRWRQRSSAGSTPTWWPSASGANARRIRLVDWREKPRLAQCWKKSSTDSLARRRHAGEPKQAAWPVGKSASRT
eukprot:3900465-Prymnesium_polylepis.1